MIRPMPDRVGTAAARGPAHVLYAVRRRGEATAEQVADSWA